MRRASAIRLVDAERSNIIADRLRSARALHKPPMTYDVTALRAAQLSGYPITRIMVLKIENGQRSVYDYEVVALSLALGVDVRYLLGLIEDPGLSDLTPIDKAAMTMSVQ